MQRSYSVFRRILPGLVMLLVNPLPALELYSGAARFQRNPIWSLYAPVVKAAFLSENLAGFGQERTPGDTSTGEQAPVVYPARPMLMSLVVPGAGQWYNQSPYWKSLLFAGIEIAGITSWWSWSVKSRQIQADYELFADLHWNLRNWWEQSDDIWGDNWRKRILEGTHHIIIVDGQGEYWKSDTLEYLVAEYGIENLGWLQNRDFYENIGKYDQFVGGWDDPWDDPHDQEGSWFILEKDVGDSIEILHTTQKKEKYMSLRYDSNQYLKMAGYAVSAVMFNHVISALEAVWSAQALNRRQERTKTSVGLIYDRQARYGIGGLAISVCW